VSKSFLCDVQPAGAGVHLRVIGDLDVSAESALTRAVTKALERRPSRVTIDLRGLATVDSRGLSLLVAARDQALRANCRLILIPGRASVQRTFLITGMDAAFTFATPRARVDGQVGHEQVVRDWLRRLSSVA
jgi:anti-sigma B factor antagonist